LRNKRKTLKAPFSADVFPSFFSDENEVKIEKYAIITIRRCEIEMLEINWFHKSNQTTGNKTEVVWDCDRQTFLFYIRKNQISEGGE